MTQPALGRVEESRVGVVPSPGAPPKTVPDVLRHAALMIEEQGWFGCSSTQEEIEAGNCAWTAIELQPGFEVRRAAREALREVIGRHDIMGWNDEPDRTAAEVTAALKAAADAYER